MSYTKTTWVNNTTPIDENNLNKIEQGIYDNSLVVDAVTNTLNPTDTETYKTAELTEGQITDVIGINDIVIKGDTEQDGTPTLSAPVDVNVVSGSNVINTSSKNLFNKDTVVNQSNYNGSVGQVISIGTNANTFRCPIFKKISDKITISANDTSATMRVLLLDEDYKILSTTAYTTLPRTIDTSNCEFIAIFFDGTTITINNNIQIEQNSSATAYEPHQGKELPLDLGNIELCKIGNYQDYFYKSGSKWYLHKEIGKKALNGSEEWTLRSGGRFSVDIPSADGDFISTGLSNQYKFIANWDTHVATNYSFTVRNGTWGVNKCRISLINTDYEDVTQFKANLATNNLIVYYQKISQLGGATNTEITDTTLISQLEAIYNAPLYEQTNITQTNNDLPMVLDITACKDNINGMKAFIRK